MQIPSLDFTAFAAAYATDELTPVQVADAIVQRIAERGDDGVWIHKIPEADLRARAQALTECSAAERANMPLYGLPFSVKDCIDIAGLPTTSACPAYAYKAATTNLAVQNALNAGAMLVGKTNMDQFATGVVGVRSPYGVARNPFDPAYIPGGSSSGAAVSVSSGLCSFAFGSDTGGSGRVPASYNNIVGLKPTLGLLSRADMVNASRHFDTISIYALTTGDAHTVLEACQGVDTRDPFGRTPPAENTNAPEFSRLRIAVPRAKDREFFGNGAAAALYEEGLAAVASLGAEITPIDFRVFMETSRMMFEGPWLAERYVAVGEFIEAHPEDIEPSVRQVILSSRDHSAVDAFRAIYRLRENAAEIRRTFETADIILVPTVGTVYSIDEVMSDPLKTNASNGLYVNFVSMADLAALAVPNGFLPNGIPMGMALVGPEFSDAALAKIGGVIHAHRVETLGATGAPFPR